MIAGALSSGSIKNADIAGSRRATLGDEAAVKTGNRPTKSASSDATGSVHKDRSRFDDVLRRQKPEAEDVASSKALGSAAPSTEKVVEEVAQESPENAQESTVPESLPVEEIVSDVQIPESLSTVSDSQPKGTAVAKDGPSANATDPRGVLKLPLVVQGDAQRPRVVSPHQGNHRPEVAHLQSATTEEHHIDGDAQRKSEQQGESGDRRAPAAHSVIAEGQLKSRAVLQNEGENGASGFPEVQQQVATAGSARSPEPAAASQRTDAAAEHQPRPIPTEVQPSNVEVPKSESSLQLERVLEAPSPGKSNAAPELKQAPSLPSKPQVDPAAQIVSRGLSAAVAQRGGSVTMQLIPETLGQVRVQMHLEHGVVSVRIETANAAAQSLLNDNLTMLRTSLESKGLLIERLSVHFSPHGLSAGTAHSAGTNCGHEPGQGGPQSQLGGQNHNAAGQGSRGNGDDAEHRSEMSDAELSAESGGSDEAEMRAQFGSTLRLRLHAVA